MQAEVLFLVDLLRLDNPADEALNLRNEPDEDSRIQHIKAGVEESKDNRNTLGLTAIVSRISHDVAYHIDKRIEHAQNPAHAKEVENQVRQCRPASRRSGTERSQIGGCRGSDILAHNQRDAQINRKHSG